MWTIPVPSSSETSSQGTTRCSTRRRAARSSNGPSYRQPDQLAAAGVDDEVLVGRQSRGEHPLAVLPQPVLARRGLTAAATFAGSVHGVVVQTTSALARPVEQREPDEERRVGLVLVDCRLSARAAESEVPQRGHHAVARCPR